LGRGRQVELLGDVPKPPQTGATQSHAQLEFGERDPDPDMQLRYDPQAFKALNEALKSGQPPSPAKGKGKCTKPIKIVITYKVTPTGFIGTIEFFC
jgi:hypothetical protein